MFFTKFKRPLLIEILFAFYLFLKLVFDYYIYGGLDSEYFKSYSMIIVLFMACSVLYRSNYKPSILALNFFLWLNFIHCFFLILQFISFNIFDNFFLLNPFGYFSTFGPDPLSDIPGPYNPMMQTIHRPNGLCWEPSVAAIWSIIYCSLSLTFIKKNRFCYLHLFVGFMSLLFIQSFLGLVYCLLIFTYIPYSIFKIKRSLKVVIFVLLLLLVSVLLYFQQDYISARLYEIFNPKTSGFLRVIAPLILLSQSVTILGAEPIGAKSFQELSEFASSGQNVHSGIANTYLEVLYFFGITGFVFLVFLLRRVKITFNKQAVIRYSIFYILLFGGWIFNSIILFTLIIFYLFAYKIKI